MMYRNMQIWLVFGLSLSNTHGFYTLDTLGENVTGLTSFVILVLILARTEKTNSRFLFFSTIFAITFNLSLKNYLKISFPSLMKGNQIS